ncbi:MAG TPA: cupin domain-containing protein [Ignavibacteria bacterium]|nr:cupin domain-containing protein [Ignavibacteria bacterium]
MKNTAGQNNFEEKAIQNSLGLLKAEEKEAFRLLTDESSEDERVLIKEYNNLTSLFSRILMFQNKELSPSSKVKDKLFEKINSEKENKPLKNKSGFNFIYSDSGDWMQHPQIQGIEIKQLAVNEDKGYLMILLKAAAGAEYPSHHHSGAEECYVLEGDLYVEGKYLGPGDFHHAEGGSDHEPLRTKNGCTLLLVVDPRDY